MTLADPNPPAPGHLHLLPSPVRIASSITGQGLPQGRLEADAAPVIHLAGANGLPASGILAVAVVFTTSEPAGDTSIRVGKSDATPVLVTSSGTTSAFAIAPVSSGDLQLHNGGSATDLTIDVVGWFSTETESGTAGLFRSLAGREITTQEIAAGATLTVKVSGEQDVPGHDFSAAMLRIRVVSAGAGTLALGPDEGTGAYVTVAYRDGPNGDLGIVAVGPDGSIVVRNTGSTSATVSLDAVGWFTSGTDADAFGDRLSLATSFEALSAADIGTDGTSQVVCGKNGIPAAATARPPSLVLARGLAGAAPAPSTLLVEAGGGASPALLALVIGASAPVAGQLLLPPDSECTAAFLTTSDTVALTVEPYAWFGGGVIISEHTRVLTGAALTAITAVTETSVTFSGASRPNLQVGDIIGAGISTTTPKGLLRRVTATSGSGDTLMVTTEPALLSDAVLQGSLSAGGTETAPAVTAPIPAAPTAMQPSVSATLARLPSAKGVSARLASVSTAVVSSAPACAVSGSLMAGGAGVACNTSFDGAGWSASANAAAGMAMT